MKSLTTKINAHLALMDAVQALDRSPAAEALMSLVPLHAPGYGPSEPIGFCKRCQTLWPCLEIIQIAEHLDTSVHELMQNAMKAGTNPTAPVDARRIHGVCTISYVVSAKAYFSELSGRDDTLGLVVTCRGDGAAHFWEFTVWEYFDRTAIAIRMFHENFAAFTDIPEFFESIAADPPATVAGVIVVLDQIGAWDATPRINPAKVGK